MVVDKKNRMPEMLLVGGGVEDCPTKKFVATVEDGWWCRCGPAEKLGCVTEVGCLK